MRSERIGSVDIFRFIMILFIMSHHLYLFGYSGNYLFCNGWAWTDYFFILTGYFTMSHYSSPDRIKDGYGREAVAYTARKFKAFLPYVMIAVTTQYILTVQPYIQQGNWKKAVVTFYDWPYEAFLLSSTGLAWPKVPPLWFLSAMLLTLPVLIYFMLRFRDLWHILAWMAPLFYYGRVGLSTDRNWPNELVRAFSCMALGTFLFMAVREVKKRPLTRLKKGFLTAAELTSFFLCVYLTASHKENMNPIPFLFSVHCVIMLSGCSHTARIKGSFCSFLGELSLPMYIFHWSIGSIALRYAAENRVRLLIYYAGTILVSCVAIILKRKIKNHMAGKSSVRSRAA